MNDFSTLWALKNSDNDKTWEQIVLPIDGQQEDLIYFNGYNYSTVGELDYWISPQINLAAASNAQLKFKLAFSPYTDEEYQESLLVAVSTDCGNTFNLLEAPYNKKGASLTTNEATVDQFFPNTESQFRTELVNLSRYAGEDVVLEQKYRGRDIKEGMEIAKGSQIDLVVGDGFGNQTLSIPNLLGMDEGEAEFLVIGSGLRMGRLSYVPTDTVPKGTIVQQLPPPGVNAKTGEIIDLWISEMENVNDF